MSGQPRVSEADGAITFDVIVVPRASRAKIGPVVGDRIKVALKAPPVDGKANAELVSALAKALGVSRGAVAIVAGERGKRKTLRVQGVDAAALLRAVEGAP